MDDCNCVGAQWAPDSLLIRYQYVSDFFIALAYFSIPLELVYFVKKSAVFPYRWVLVQVFKRGSSADTIIHITWMDGGVRVVYGVGVVYGEGAVY